MKYEIIQTGSDGNATVINGNVLIDCGVPYKKIEPYVNNLGLVLMTHEHSDHFNPSTVRRLARNRPSLHWAACEWMIPHLLAAGVDQRSLIPSPIIPGKWYGYGDLGMISAFETYHNVRNCGWRFICKGERALYATDLGCIPDGLTALHYDYYFLEANHREAEIEAAVAEAEENGEYSYRIMAAENHLSYEQALDWLTDQMGPQSLWIPMHEHKEREVRDGGEKNVFTQNHEP